MKIKKELLSNQTILLVIPSLKYNDLIINTVKSLSKKSVCYVTLNKTYDSLKEVFQKSKVNVDNIVFIDAISKTFKKTPDQTDHCYFVSSPSALTELSLNISKILTHNFDYLIFDSLTNLLIYQSKAPVAMFVSNLVNKIKASNTKAIFYALSIKEQEALIKESSMFVDKVMDLSE